MRSAASFKLGLSHSAATDSTWKVEAVKQVEYHVIAARNLFAKDSTRLLDGCSPASLHRGDRRLIVIDANVDRITGIEFEAETQSPSPAVQSASPARRIGGAESYPRPLLRTRRSVRQSRRAGGNRHRDERHR